MPYFNPSTSMGSNANMIPGNPLAGALAGIQTGLSLEAGKQDFQDSRLKFMENLHKFQQDQLDDPLNAAKRESGIADANVKTGWDQSGGALSTLQAGLDSTLATTAGNQADTKKKQNDAAGEFINRLSQEMDAHTNPSKNPGETTKWWEDKKKEAGQHQITWDGIVPTEEARAQMKAKAAAFANSIATQQKMMEEKARQDAETARAINPGNSTSTEGRKAIEKQTNEDMTARQLAVAAQTTSRAVQVANIRNEGMNQTLVQAAEKRVAAGDLSQIDMDADSILTDRLSKDKTLAMEVFSNPGMRETMLHTIKSQIISGAGARQRANNPTASAPSAASVSDKPPINPKADDTWTNAKGRKYKFDATRDGWVGQ